MSRKLIVTQPRVSFRQVSNEIDFEPLRPDEVREDDSILDVELRILRDEVDRDKLYNWHWIERWTAPARDRRRT